MEDTTSDTMLSNIKRDWFLVSLFILVMGSILFIGLVPPFLKTNERDDILLFHDWEKYMEFPYDRMTVKGAQIICEYNDRCEGGWSSPCIKNNVRKLKMVRIIDMVMHSLMFYHNDTSVDSDYLYDTIELFEALRLANITNSYNNAVSQCSRRRYHYVAGMVREQLPYDVEAVKRRKKNRIRNMNDTEKSVYDRKVTCNHIALWIEESPDYIIFYPLGYLWDLFVSRVCLMWNSLSSN